MPDEARPRSRDVFFFEWERQHRLPTVEIESRKLFADLGQSCCREKMGHLNLKSETLAPKRQVSLGLGHLSDAELPDKMRIRATFRRFSAGLGTGPYLSRRWFSVASIAFFVVRPSNAPVDGVALLGLST